MFSPDAKESILKTLAAYRARSVGVSRWPKLAGARERRGYHPAASTARRAGDNKRGARSYIKTRNIINNKDKVKLEFQPLCRCGSANQRPGVGGGGIPTPKRATGIRGRAGKFGGILPHPATKDLKTVRPRAVIPAFDVPWTGEPGTVAWVYRTRVRPSQRGRCQP